MVAALAAMVDGFPLAVIAILSFVSVFFLGFIAFVTTPWLLWVSFSQLAALGGLPRGDPKAARRILRSATSRIVVLAVLLIAIVANGAWHRTGVWVAAFLTSALIVLACALRLDTARRSTERPLGPWPHMAAGGTVGMGVVLAVAAIALSSGAW